MCEEYYHKILAPTSITKGKGKKSQSFIPLALFSTLKQENIKKEFK